jgi:phosphoglycolate phosphatase
MKFHTVLFDLDGTLTDPGEGITNSVRYALWKFGIEESDRKKLEKFIGPPLTRSFAEHYGFGEEKAKQALEYYREYFADKGIFENEIYPGIPGLLAELKGNGVSVVLATSKPEPFAREILRHFGIHGFFDLVAGNTLDEKRPLKSDVIGYLVNERGVRAGRETVMVGDRVYDVQGGKQFGLYTVAVAYGYGCPEELEGADRIAGTVEELRGILLGN